MRPCRDSILALFVYATAVLPAAADNTIVIAAQEVATTVAPRPARARVISLPPLTFKLRAAIRCAGEPVSVTLSVADTFVTKGRDELEGRRATEASLTVPPSQLTMAASRRFCTKGEHASGDELFAPGFATAHASLRCEDESGVSVHYASAPLNVRLHCSREADDGEVDQESSSDAAR
jgi:hypothetical protein